LTKLQTQQKKNGRKKRGSIKGKENSWGRVRKTDGGSSKGGRISEKRTGKRYHTFLATKKTWRRAKKDPGRG